MSSGEASKTEAVFTANRDQGVFVLTCLSVGVMLGGVGDGWQKAGEEGFGYAMLTLSGTSLAYFALTACLSEMASMFPFSGGVFGYIRCSLGPFMGYLVGCIESTQNLLFLTAIVNTITTALVDSAVADTQDLLDRYEGFIAASVLLSLTVIQCYGGSSFWHYMVGMTGLSVIILLVYIFGSIPSAEYAEHGYNGQLGPAQIKTDAGDTVRLFNHLQFMMWIFKGVEIPTMLCEEAKDVNHIPVAMISSLSVVILLSFAVVSLAYSQAPGIAAVSDTEFPLDYGFNKIFDMNRGGFLFTIPLCIVSAQAFLFALSKQLHAMSLSGLLPPVFSQLNGPNKTPIVAIASGSALSLLILVLKSMSRDLEDHLKDLYTVAFIFLTGVYVMAFYAYYTFVTRFSTVPRKFAIPGMLSSAAVAIGTIVFVVSFVGLVVFDMRSAYGYTFALVLLLMWSVYYKLAVEERQFFSPEEQKIFLKAYIVNAHVYKKNARKFEKYMQKVFFCFKFEDKNAAAKKKKRQETAHKARSAEERQKRVAEHNQAKIDKHLTPTIAKLAAHNNVDIKDVVGSIYFSDSENSVSSNSSDNSSVTSHDSERVDAKDSDLSLSALNDEIEAELSTMRQNMVSDEEEGSSSSSSTSFFGPQQPPSGRRVVPLDGGVTSSNSNSSNNSSSKKKKKQQQTGNKVAPEKQQQQQDGMIDNANDIERGGGGCGGGAAASSTEAVTSHTASTENESARKNRSDRGKDIIASGKKITWSGKVISCSVESKKLFSLVTGGGSGKTGGGALHHDVMGLFPELFSLVNKNGERDSSQTTEEGLESSAFVVSAGSSSENTLEKENTKHEEVDKDTAVSAPPASVNVIRSTDKDAATGELRGAEIV